MAARKTTSSKQPPSFTPPNCPFAGVDEAGRGCLAGPVVAAAVLLPQKHPIVGLADSKKLSTAKRDKLSLEIKHHAIAWSVGVVWPRTIDTINILQATFLAMARAVYSLKHPVPLLLIDGNKTIPEHVLVASRSFFRWHRGNQVYTQQQSISQCTLPLEHFPQSTTSETPQNKYAKQPTPIERAPLVPLQGFSITPIGTRKIQTFSPHFLLPEQRAFVGGDDFVPSISAASIIAKTFRDNLMIHLDRHYPLYGFAQHKGYGTAEHLAAIAQHGACPQHRLTFKGVRPAEPVYKKELRLTLW